VNTEIIVLAAAFIFGAVLVPLVWWFFLRREGKRLLPQAHVDAEKVV
jgi:peptidoglycan biosynthesis protein MviN/MurJ (putative lipid II flippase)